jgi:hypothetical protein
VASKVDSLSYLKKYLVKPAEYELMFSMQNGVCAICNQKSVHKLAVDHNHETGEVRGLLCKQCNVGLGMFKEEIRWLENAIQYIRDGGHDSRFYVKTNRLEQNDKDS